MVLNICQCGACAKVIELLVLARIWKWCLLASLVCSGPLVLAETPRWLSGSLLEAKLKTKGSVTWSRVPLEKILANLSDLNHFDILLDRRVNREQLVSLNVQDQTLSELFNQLASNEHLSITRVSAAIYIGPQDRDQLLTESLQMQEKELAKLALEQRRIWQATAPLEWPDLTEPRQWVEQELAKAKVILKNPELIPHDLWHERTGPAMTLTERMSLVLIQFDLALEWDESGKAIRLVPLVVNNLIAAKRERPVTIPGISANAEKKSSLKSDAKQGDTKLLDAKSIKSNTTKQAGEKRYTLTVNMPLKPLMLGLAKKMELEMVFDEKEIAAAGISLQQDVQIKVKEVSQEELFRTILQPAGLKYTQESGVVHVLPVNSRK